MCLYTAVGSVLKRDVNKLYNSCPVFDPSGVMVAKYHKMYLADTFVPAQLVVKESDVFTEGNKPAVINTRLIMYFNVSYIILWVLAVAHA